jgi:hypothetical protein
LFDAIPNAPKCANDLSEHGRGLLRADSTAPASKQSAFRERRDAMAGDDEMIQRPDATRTSAGERQCQAQSAREGSATPLG